MSYPVDTWRYGLGMGSVAGLVDAGLTVLLNPDVSYWALGQAATAWTLVGWVVMATNSGLRPLGHGAFVTLLLHLPLMIQAVAAGNLFRVPELVAMSVLFGAVLGIAKWRLSMPRGGLCEWVGLEGR